MKKYFLLSIFVASFFTVCHSQQIESQDKLNQSIGRVLLDLNSLFKDCKLYNFMLKIEYKDLEIIDISLSDGVDSLFIVEFMKQKDKLDFIALNSYLKSHNLQSATFIKPVYYILSHSRCRGYIESLKYLNNMMRFNGIEFIGSNIRLMPYVRELKAAH